MTALYEEEVCEGGPTLLKSPDLLTERVVVLVGERPAELPAGESPLMHLVEWDSCRTGTVFLCCIAEEDARSNGASSETGRRRCE